MLGLNYGTCMNAGSVANAFQFSRRRENLSFTHHTEALALAGPALQDRFLDWCLEPETSRSTRELREAISPQNSILAAIL